MISLVMIQAYNDWRVDQWCGAHTDRFIPCGILPLFDVELVTRRSEGWQPKG